MSSNKHQRKLRQERTLKRHQETRAPYERVLIVCEGEKTEFNYFKNLIRYARLNSANIEVIFGKGSAPISIVDHAIERLEHALDFDRVFCVFDRDDHESYERAIDKLRRYKPKSKTQCTVITSFPCFETWILLHFGYTAKAYARKGHKSACEYLLSDLKGYFPDYSKNMTNLFDVLIDRLPEALKYAKRLQKENKHSGSVNPATNLHELVCYLMGLKPPA